MYLTVDQKNRDFSYFTRSGVDSDYTIPGECEKTGGQNRSQWRR